MIRERGNTYSETQQVIDWIQLIILLTLASPWQEMKVNLVV